MKRHLYFNPLILLLTFLSLAPLCLSQNANTSNPTNQNTEVLGENERLPFMQTEEAPESQEPSSSGLLFKTLGAMLLIVGLLFFGAWGLKKLGFGGAKATGGQEELNLTVLSSISMGSGRTISTIRFGERVLLVGVTPQAFTLLAEETPHDDFSIQNPRSVAEMLADDNRAFVNELQRAQSSLSLWDGKGENA